MLIDGLRLKTIGPSIVQHIIKFSELEFWKVSDLIDGCAGRNVGQDTVRQWPPLIAPVDFLKNLFLVCFGYGVLQTITNLFGPS